MKMSTFALALIASIATLSPAFAASKVKHMATSKHMVSRDAGDAAVAKLNQEQLDKIKSGQ